MKREWRLPVLEEVMISKTANGAEPNFDFDGPWETITIDGKEYHYRPGASRESQTN